MDCKIFLDKLLESLKSKDFKYVNDNGFEYISNGKKAFCVEFDQDSGQIHLKVAELVEGADVVFASVSSWLFDSGSSEKDKQSISADFRETALEQLGSNRKISDNISLPQKSKNEDVVTMESFTAKFLAAFPAHKQDYKDNIAKNKRFFFDEFYSEFGALELRKVLSEDKKKPVEKFFNLLNDGYINGDSEVATTVLYSILASGLASDPSLSATALNYLEPFAHLKRTTTQMLSILSSNSNSKKYL